MNGLLSGELWAVHGSEAVPDSRNCQTLRVPRQSRGITFSFTIDHVIPLTHGGTDAFRNLALACFHCNRRKADRVVVVEPESKEEVALFNPRQHVWSEHFIWSADGLLVIGLTPTGRATIAALALNRERIVAIREADRTAGRHPPPGDPIQSKQSEGEP